MKILIIGGTGHVGAFLTQILIAQGHDVVIASRGHTAPPTHASIEGAHFVTCDSGDIASLTALSESEHFDAVVDFPGTAWNVWNVFKDKAHHVIACGSMWMFGCPKVVPTPEQTQGPCMFDIYEVRYAQIGQMLCESLSHHAAFSAIMPPNISGPGRMPLDSLGGRSADVHHAGMRGETVYLPDGPEALICPCDAYDLASLFALAINDRTHAAGQIFNGGTEQALTATQFVNTLAEIYGTRIPIEYVSWEQYKNEISPSIGYWWHFYAHMCPDISKAKTLLGYRPRYTSQEAMRRAVEWAKRIQIL